MAVDAELIANLLAKAERTDNEHEAEAYTAKAEALMIKHAIDRATVEDAAGKKDAPEPMVVQNVYVGGSFAAPLADIAWRIGAGMKNVFIYLSPDGGRNQSGWMKVCGRQSDVESAIQLIKSIHAQALHQMKIWWKTDPTAPTWMASSPAWRAKKAYLRGFGDGVGLRLANIRKAAEGDAQPGAALALRDRGKAAEDWATAGTSMRSLKSREMAANENALGAGYRDGQNAVTGEAQVGNRKGINA